MHELCPELHWRPLQVALRRANESFQQPDGIAVVNYPVPGFVLWNQLGPVLVVLISATAPRVMSSAPTGPFTMLDAAQYLTVFAVLSYLCRRNIIGLGGSTRILPPHPAPTDRVAIAVRPSRLDDLAEALRAASPQAAFTSAGIQFYRKLNRLRHFVGFALTLLALAAIYVVVLPPLLTLGLGASVFAGIGGAVIAGGVYWYWQWRHVQLGVRVEPGQLVASVIVDGHIKRVRTFNLQTQPVVINARLNAITVTLADDQGACFVIPLGTDLTHAAALANAARA